MVPGDSFVRVLAARREMGARRDGSRGLEADVEYTRTVERHRSDENAPGHAPAAAGVSSMAIRIRLLIRPFDS